MAREPYPSETQDRFLLRMPDGMRDRLKAEAEANKRSMNAEIVARLEVSLGSLHSNRPNLSPGQQQFYDLLHHSMMEIVERAKDNWEQYKDAFPDDGPHKYFDEDEKK